MGGFKGVNVQIVSGGEILKLYDDPDAEPEQDPRTRQRYVEAVTGATFKVRVTLSKHFRLHDLMPDDAIRLSIKYDGQGLEWYVDIVVKDIRQTWNEGERKEYDFTTLPSFCNHTQQWKQGDTCFGVLNTNENAGAGMSVDDVKDLGRLRVKIWRVHRTKRAVPRPCSMRTQGPVTEVSEKILKGRAIGNIVSVSENVPSRAPPPTMYNEKSMNGIEGQPLFYNIFYRSKHTLQMLGCIPRTPSPEPEDTPIDTTANEREARVQALRAELALLEGDLNIKREGPGAKTRIKRELEDTENESQRKRLRHSGLTETVDLTSD